MSIVNFFKMCVTSVVGFLHSALSDLVAVFGSVADTVTGLQLFPLTSMFGAMIACLINAVIGIMQLLIETGIGIFSAVDISGNQISLFQLILMRGEDTLPSFFIVLAMTLLVINTGISLANTMVMPNEGRSPVMTMLIAVIAGGGIYYCRWICQWVGGLFNLFYRYVLGCDQFSNIQIAEFAQKLTKIILTDRGGITTTGQMQAIAVQLIVLIVLVLITVRMVSFFFGFISRYLLYCLTILMAPLAVAFAPLNRSSKTVPLYIRFFFNQFLLLILHVFFLRLFLTSFLNFSGTVDSLVASNAAESSSLVLLWCFSLYAILYIAGKMDQYLRAIGGSSGEAGTSVLAGLWEDIVDNGVLILGRSHGISGGSTGEASSAHRSIIGPEGPTWTLRDIDPLTRSVRQKELDRILRSNDSISGEEIGRAIIMNQTGIPGDLASHLEYGSAVLCKGIIAMHTKPNQNGVIETLVLYPQEYELGNRESLAHCIGRPVQIGDQEYLAVLTYIDPITGKEKEDTEFLLHNPSLGNALAENGYEQVEWEISDNDGIMTAVSIHYGYASMNLLSPATMYEPDPLLRPYSALVRLGELEYWDTGLSQAKPFHAFNVSEKNCGDPETFLHAHFKEYGDDICNVELIQPDILQYEDENQYRHIIVPAEFYCAGHEFREENCEPVTMDNGACYLDIRLDQTDDMHSVIKRRTNESPVIRKRNPSNYRTTILREAKRRKKGGRS